MFGIVVGILASILHGILRRISGLDPVEYNRKYVVLYAMKTSHGPAN